MIDINKLKRFEEAFEKHNSRQELAKFWNELEPQLYGSLRYIESMEEAQSKMQYKIQFNSKTEKMIRMAEKTLRQLKGIKNGS